MALPCLGRSVLNPSVLKSCDAFITTLTPGFGYPPPHSVKFFAASELLEQVKDRTWLGKVTNTLNHHWQKRNAAKKRSQNGHVTASVSGSSDQDNLSTGDH
jgi:hypothetical protein